MIYGLMFYITLSYASLISCRRHLLRNRKGELVNPSQLNDKWFLPEKKIDTNETKLLYVGRIRVEKGIFSLIEMILNTELKLSIVASEIKHRLKKIPSNIEVISHHNKNDSIIQFYDNHNIFILPSLQKTPTSIR